MELTRRTLLSGALAGSAAPLPAAAPNWNTLRNEFPLETGLVYMNAANIAPAPVSVCREYLSQLADFQANPSFQNREIYKTLAETVRGRAARWLHADAEEIAILRNTSEASNLITQGVPLRRGDEVLITAHNHPSNSDSWRLRCRKTGAEVITAPVPVNAQTPSDLLDSLTRHVTAKTKVIAVSHFTNTTGLLYPVRELAAIAKQHGAWFHVDGAQTFGWMNLDLHELGMDSYSGSMHKWPMGPVESGILYIRRDRLDRVEPLILSHGYWADQPAGIRVFEQLGQRDDARLKAMEKTFDFLERLGAAATEKQALETATKLRVALAKVPGAKVLGSGAPAVSGPVVKVDFPGKDLKQMDTRLWSRHKLSIAVTAAGESRGLRFSPHVYNTLSEIDTVAGALRELS
jgi:selenocysteine lyase/cysteine desulfurase